MFTKLINVIIFAVILSVSVASLAVARGGDGGGDGGGDHAGAHQIEDPSCVPGGDQDHGRDSGRPTNTQEKSIAFQCLQMIVVDHTIPNASEDCGYGL